MPRERDDDDDDRPIRKARRRDDDEDDDREESRKSSRREEDDERDSPRSGPPPSNMAATASLVLGILAFFCLGITAPFALIFGLIGLKNAGKTGTGKGMALAGLGLGAVGLLVMIGSGIGIYFLSTMFAKQYRQNAAQQRARNDLRQIGLALHGYHDVNVVMPTADAWPVGGQLMPPADVSQRLSWRANVLPFIEQDNLYQRLKFEEPWNGPTNGSITASPVMQYADQDTPTSSQTRYRVFVGNGAMFDEPQRIVRGANMRPRRGVSMVAITDGLSNTIMVAQAAQTVPWGQYNELPFDPKGPLPQLGRTDRDYFLVLMGDGSTKIINKNIDPSTLKAAITRNGGEVVFLP